MKIGILTSSRADYGIYQPLLKKMSNDSYFQVEIIAFGTHLSKLHDYTLKIIEKDNFGKVYALETLIDDDTQLGTAKSYAKTISVFADFWNENNYDLVLCLGDRFEMNAAVQSGIPFGVKFAHLYGGETTLGAFDNIFRHQISLASQLHFTATEQFSKRVSEITQDFSNVFVIGSLSLDELFSFQPKPKTIFLEQFGISKGDYVLVTFHPETMSFDKNTIYAKEMRLALSKISEHMNVVVTMPNADTRGSVIRQELMLLHSEHLDRVVLVENFGKDNYFTAMYHSKMLIGNTSSGIIEAASFNKYVINVGNRQKGRLQSKNIVNCDFIASDIYNVAMKLYTSKPYEGENIYFRKGAADKVIKILKEFG